MPPKDIYSNHHNDYDNVDWLLMNGKRNGNDHASTAEDIWNESLPRQIFPSSSSSFIPSSSSSSLSLSLPSSSSSNSYSSLPLSSTMSSNGPFTGRRCTALTERRTILVEMPTDPLSSEESIGEQLPIPNSYSYSSYSLRSSSSSSSSSSFRRPPQLVQETATTVPIGGSSSFLPSRVRTGREPLAEMTNFYSAHRRHLDRNHHHNVREVFMEDENSNNTFHGGNENFSLRTREIS